MDSFERKLDDKYRLTIPVELRGEFAGGRVIITRGFGAYLHLYPEMVWKAEMEVALSGQGWKGERPVILNEELANLNDRFRDGKVTAELDAKQGRIGIDPRLLRRVGMSRQIVAVRMPAAKGSYWRLKGTGDK